MSADDYRVYSYWQMHREGDHGQQLPHVTGVYIIYYTRPCYCLPVHVHVLAVTVVVNKHITFSSVVQSFLGGSYM
jgi:hypothetical protein